MKQFISLIIFSFLALAISAQPTIDQVYKKGLEQYYAGNYIGAAQNLDQVISRGDNQNEEVWFFLAQATQKHYAYNASERAYEFLIDSLKSEDYPAASFELAQIKQTLGKYDEALRYYDLYLSEFEGDDTKKTAIAKLGKQSSEWAVKEKGTPKAISDDSITINHLGTDVNTPYSEHGGVEIDDKLYYSSLRYPSKKRSDWYQEVVSKVLTYDTASVEMEAGEYFNNSKQLTSSSAFSADGKVMVYSICDYGEDAIIECELYYRQKTEDGSWGQEFKLPPTINAEGSTSTQPSFGKEENNKIELFFVSNRDGGTGGMDIYKTVVDSEMEWGDPENVKSVNTIGDEVTPFFNDATSTLYFSTNGRVGMGGHDVHKATFDSGIFTEITNLGMEYNSPQEDIYYTINSDETEAHMSSNRFGSMFLEDKFETCCFDIYQIYIKPCEVDLLALLFDKDTEMELTGVTLTVKDLTDDEAEDIVVTNDEGNDFELMVDCDKEYEILAEKPGYEPSTITLKTRGGNNPIEEKIYLKQRKIELEVALFERATGDPLYEGDVVLLDVTTGKEIVPSSFDGHKAIYDVIPGHEYKIVAKKEGYDPEEISFVIDIDQKENIKKDIFMGRVAEVKEIAKLIPLKLFFDNDEPERRTLEQTTNQSFSDTYDKYYARKEKFKQMYARRFNKEEKEAAKARIETFFETEVKDGHKTLQIFTEALDRTLQKGLTINLYLRGYASPIASDEYNFAIGQRRIQSIRNEFARYNGGVLAKYLQSGQLKIKQRSFGEESAPEGISDSQRNVSSSIYSPEASFERRIELEEITDASEENQDD